MHLNMKFGDVTKMETHGTSKPNYSKRNISGYLQGAPMF